MQTKIGRENLHSRWDSMAVPARFLFRRHGGIRQNATPAHPGHRFRELRAAMWDAAILRLHVEISLKVFQDSVQGNADPVRPALKLIFHFEQSFLQSISVQ